MANVTKTFFVCFSCYPSSANYVAFSSQCVVIVSGYLRSHGRQGTTLIKGSLNFLKIFVNIARGAGFSRAAFIFRFGLFLHKRRGKKWPTKLEHKHTQKIFFVHNKSRRPAQCVHKKERKSLLAGTTCYKQSIISPASSVGTRRV